jgi:quercetin dioxygenase-like cupin family protein
VKALFAFVPEICTQGPERARAYREFLRVPAMSAGVYVLPVGETDSQKPHHEDEIYYVIRGRSRFKADKEDHEVSAGSVIFVAAEVEHHFYDVTEELAVLVIFAPAES